MRVRRIAAVALSVVLLLLVGVVTAGAGLGKGKVPKKGRLQLPIAGTVGDATGGTFTGTLSITRFAASQGEVVAIGTVSGSMTDAAGLPLGTGLVGLVTLPVAVGAGAATAQGGGVVIQQTCGILHLEIGAVNLDLLGLQITTLPIGIDISGDSEGVLGQLVCLILDVLGNLLGLVELLNSLLDLLGGLTG